jgi:hypothetical protein
MASTQLSVLYDRVSVESPIIHITPEKKILICTAPRNIKFI